MRQKVISKTVLEHQYQTMKVLDILEYYDICCAKFYNLLDEAGIERKIKNRTPARERVIVTLKD